MTQADREKWDQRYREGSYKARTHPTELLVEWLERLPRGRALDVASGAGRNALFLAEAGYRVDAIDVSAVALERAERTARERGLSVEWIVADLDDAELARETYDVVVVARFVDRRLVPRLKEALADGGHLIYEHHLQTPCDVGGPRSNPEFRLRPNELLHLFWDLRVLYYREGIIDDPDGRRMALAQLVACKGSPGF